MLVGQRGGLVLFSVYVRARLVPVFLCDFHRKKRGFIYPFKKLGAVKILENPKCVAIASAAATHFELCAPQGPLLSKIEDHIYVQIWTYSTIVIQ